MKNLLTMMLLLMFSVSSHAFTKTITEEHVLGDGESKTTAREAVLEKIKQKAANSAGVYIQSDKSINSKGYSESIQSISASIVKFKNQKETLGLKNGAISMKITATVDINEKVLKDRIKAIQSDKKKAKLIKKLSDDNKALLARMAKLENALQNKKLSTRQIADILNEKARITGTIVKNNQSAEKVFSRGTLFAMANMTANKDKELYDAWHTKWRNFFEDLNLKLEPKVLSIKPSGNMYIARIGVKFPKNFIKRAQRKFCVKDDCYGTRLSMTHTKEGKYQRWVDDTVALVKVAMDHPVTFKAGIPGKTFSMKLAGLFKKGFFGSDSYKSMGSTDISELERELTTESYADAFAAIRNKEKRSEKKNVHIDWDSDSIIVILRLSKRQAESAEKVVASVSVR